MAEKTPTTPEPVAAAPEPRGMEHPDDLQTEDRSKKDREVWDSILAKHKGEQLSSEPQASSEAPPTDRPEETPQPQGQAPPKEDPKPETREPSAPRDERKAAEQFLRLKAGVPQTALEGLDDQAVLEWAEERRTREATVDAAFARAKRAEKETEATDTDTTPTDEGEPSEPTPESEPFVDDDLADELALTDEGRARLDERFKAKLNPMEERLNALEKRDQAADTKGKIDLVQRIREEVGARVPDLADDDKFAKVIERATALEMTPEFAGSGRPPQDYLAELFEETARGLGFKIKPTAEEASAAREAAERQQERHERIEASAGSDPTPRPTDPRQKTQIEADWDVFQRVRDRHRGAG